MKHRFRLLAGLLAGMLLFPLSACTSGEQLLYTVADGARSYAVYGKPSRASKITVTENGSTVWEKKVKVKKSVGSQDGTYGFEVLDLNFDGLSDIKIAVEANGELLTEICFLQTESGSYERSDAFNGLYNIGVNAELSTVFGFAHTEQIQPAVGEVPESYRSTDAATAYVWEMDKLVPYLRVSLTYYSAQNIYCYSVANNPTGTDDFSDSDDKWLTPEEYQKTDFGFLYYFRK